jgi:hypothetical protein
VDVFVDDVHSNVHSSGRRPSACSVVDVFVGDVRSNVHNARVAEGGAESI